MTNETLDIELAYQRLWGRLNGYLPSDRSAIDTWQTTLQTTLVDSELVAIDRIYKDPVQKLKRLIDTNGIVLMYVSEAIDQVPDQYKHIHTVDELLAALDYIIGTAPHYEADPTQRVFFPLSALFVYMMMTNAGEALFRNTEFNDVLTDILKAWCAYLDNPASRSVLNDTANGWLCASAYSYNRLDEFVIPDKGAAYWGWASFNDFFHRQIQPDQRPIQDPDDPRVVVSANDGTVYNIVRDVKKAGAFWAKGQEYSLSNILNQHDAVDDFVGGDVFQSFLSGADYHRWRSPIQGKVLYTQVVNGLTFSDCESAGFDPTASTYSQGYEASVNTRGLVLIDSEDAGLGKVWVIPLGITEISSITIDPAIKPGTTVKKGDELGYFSYGGSSLVLIFQKGAIKQFTVPVTVKNGDLNVNQKIQVGRQIAVANYRGA